MTSLNDFNAVPEIVATPEESEAAEWIAVRGSQKEWSSERQAELEAWLARSLANRVAYIRINATWRRTDRLAALRKPMKPTVISNAPHLTRWFRIAGVLGLVAIIGVVATTYLQRTHGQLIQTPKGGQERLTLSDGSQVELNTDSAVSIDIRDNSRRVELVRGEAFFDIRHDSSRPFIVVAGTHRIVDLGTKFLVRTGPDMVKVALVEGSARLENTNDQSRHRTVVLTSDEVAIANSDVVRISRHTQRELSESLAWQRGKVVFHNEPLADAAVELNRYGGLELIVADADSAKLLINGTFLTNNAEEFAEATHELFGLRVEHRNGNLILSR
jgi:transmembrane sensor